MGTVGPHWEHDEGPQSQGLPGEEAPGPGAAVPAAPRMTGVGGVESQSIRCSTWRREKTGCVDCDMPGLGQEGERPWSKTQEGRWGHQGQLSGTKEARPLLYVPVCVRACTPER